MKTQDVIDLALAAGLCQDGDMFFSPTTGDADVHISDLEYFAKTIEGRILSRQRFDMYTKLQSVYTSGKYVQKSDISMQEQWDTSDMAYRPNGLSIEQEPVAWLSSPNFIEQETIEGRPRRVWFECIAGVGIPLYTAPPKRENELDLIERAYFAGKKDCIAESQWVSLTDDEIEKIVDLNTSDDAGYDIFCDGLGVARAVIDKLKERNNE